MTKEQHRALLARQLAKYFSDNHLHDRACACNAGEATCIDCSLWWDMFLERHDRNEIEIMVDLYRLCKERISITAPMKRVYPVTNIAIDYIVEETP